MAAQLQYEPNQLAAALRKGKSYLIGIIIPAIDINFFARVVKGIEAVLNEEGYNAIITQSDDQVDKEARNVDTLLNTQVDGIICSLANTATTYEHLDKILDKGVPLVLFDRTTMRGDISTVVINDYKGAYDATEHLLQLGCQSILHLAGPEQMLPYRLRAKGYQDVLRQYGLDDREDLVRVSRLTRADGARCVQEVLSKNISIDGIFAASDQAAFGAMQVLQKRGVRIPEEVAIVGFSNEGFGSFITPSLSTVEQHGVKMGEWAAKLLLEQCESTNRHREVQQIVLPAELIVRSSSSK